MQALIRGLAFVFVLGLAVAPPLVLVQFTGGAQFEQIKWAIVVNSIAIPIGIILSLLWYLSICALAGQSDPFNTGIDLSFASTGILMGAVERYFFGVAVALNWSGVVIGMVAWTVLKAQSHWNLFTRPPGSSGRQAYMGMFGSLFSMLLAGITGHVCQGLSGH